MRRLVDRSPVPVAVVALLCLSWTALPASGAATDPLAGGDPHVVLIFTRTDCPISNRYAPEIRRLAERFAPRGVAFWLVYPDPGTTEEQILRHRREFDYGMAWVRDPRHELVARAGASVTPEVAVFDRRRRLVYRGRIDDRFVALGKTRPRPTVRDLEHALDALLAGAEVPVSRTQAVGCFIADLE